MIFKLFVKFKISTPKSISTRIFYNFLVFSLIFSCSEKRVLNIDVINQNEVGLSVPVGWNYKSQENLLDFSETIIVKQNIDGKLIEVPFQLDSLENKLWFQNILENKASNLSYQIENGIPSNAPTNLSKSKTDNDLQLLVNGTPVINYRYTITFPPEGIDSLYRKSGFIHPIITPKGDTLTRIQPEDHYHHYGLWGPWTHTQIDGERVDFWNLREGMGTVRFKEFKDNTSGKIFTSFTAAQEHVDFKTKEKPQVALNEDLQVKLWNLNRPDRYMFDYITNFSSPLENGILFEAYRYGGGLGLRFHERWKADNCTVLTSEGKDRSNADGSNARWCIVSGESSDGKGTNGILFLSHPENRMHPEPMRIWPVDANSGRGDMFFEFCPIRHEEWQIEPDKNYGLKYRMIVFDGELGAYEAEAYWQHFAKEPKIEVTKN